MNAGIFDRDGHLTELGLDRVAIEPETLSADALTAAAAHLEACAVCRDAREALVTFDSANTLPPRAATPAAIATPGRPSDGGRILGFRRPLAAVGAVFALAAAVLLAVRLVPTDPDPESFRLKGDNRFTFNVYIHDGATATHASHAAFPVNPGDRMGFVVTADRPGYLLIVGWDASGQHYGCFPQEESGGPHAGPGNGATAAVRIDATPTPWTVPSAMAFDDLPGRENVAAVFCDAPFTRADLAVNPCVGEPVAGQACTARCLSFDKRPAPQPTEEMP